MNRGLLVASCLGAIVLHPAAASALPGDPPITIVSPANGATVAADPAGIVVTITCSLYKKSSAGGEGFETFGDCSDHTADFASGPELGNDGRLRSDQIVARGRYSPDNTTPSGQRRVLLREGTPSGPEVTPGRYYVQAYRGCPGCQGGYETSPVQSFVVRAAISDIGLDVPSRVYAGYQTVFQVHAKGAPNGAPVAIERRQGSQWREVASSLFTEGRSRLVGVLPSGSQSLRVVSKQGDETIVGGSRTVNVVTARNWTTTRDAGRYAGSSEGQPVRARVPPGGRTLRDFETTVSMLCAGASIQMNSFLDGTAALPLVKIAPDGRFFARRRYSKETLVEIQGRLSKGRLSGRVELEVGVCSGGKDFSVRRSP